MSSASTTSQRSIPSPASNPSRDAKANGSAPDSREGGEGCEGTHVDVARLTLILFDDHYEVPIKSQPLGQVPLLTRQTFVPRGSTALLDAIGRTIKKMTVSFAARPAANRPDTIIVAILTDGEENASRTFSQAHIADLIAEKRAQGWEFIFLAANQDAIAEATRLSIPSADARRFVTTPDGMREGFRDFDDLMRRKRGK